MPIREAINSAIDEEMARDERVFIIGEFVFKTVKICHRLH
jgi:pyruvate/2-oxoglutarate/acetoin dehydrogenase E1 component